MVEKVLFLCLIFKVGVLMDLHVLRSAESESHTFSVGSMCMCAVCYQHNLKTKLQHEHQIWYSTFDSYTNEI